MKNLSKTFEQYVGRDINIHPLPQIVGTWEYQIEKGRCYVLNEHACPTAKEMFAKAAFHSMKVIICLPRHPEDLGYGPEFAESRISAEHGVVTCTVEPNGKKGFRIASIAVRHKKTGFYSEYKSQLLGR